jgi:hypothetical protein
VCGEQLDDLGEHGEALAPDERGTEQARRSALSSSITAA